MRISSEAGYLQVLSARNEEDGMHESSTGVTMMGDQEAVTIASISVLDSDDHPNTPGRQEEKSEKAFVR